jgi:hypothetical protein
MIMRWALVLLLMVGAPLRADDSPDARTIVARAFEAAGGEAWARADSLWLSGRAVFFGDGPQPRAVAEDYQMWRAFEDGRVDAHGEAGKVLIHARADGRTLFLVGSDGTQSFNEKGLIPKPEADKFWANNFGFGVIRSALGPGFTLQRLPDDSIDGHPAYMVRVTDPGGSTTLFGVDKESYLIRLAGFSTPSGWHVRIYDDFVVQPGWTQARKVTLYYNGTIANQVFWTDWKVNLPLAEDLFSPDRSIRGASSTGPATLQKPAMQPSPPIP